MRQHGTHIDGTPHFNWPDCGRIRTAIRNLQTAIKSERFDASPIDRGFLDEALKLMQPVEAAVQQASDEIDRQCEAYAAEDHGGLPIGAVA